MNTLGELATRHLRMTMENKGCYINKQMAVSLSLHNEQPNHDLRSSGMFHVPSDSLKALLK